MKNPKRIVPEKEYERLKKETLEKHKFYKKRDIYREEESYHKKTFEILEMLNSLICIIKNKLEGLDYCLREKNEIKLDLFIATKILAKINREDYLLESMLNRPSKWDTDIKWVTYKLEDYSPEEESNNEK